MLSCCRSRDASIEKSKGDDASTKRSSNNNPSSTKFGQVWADGPERGSARTSIRFMAGDTAGGGALIGKPVRSPTLDTRVLAMSLWDVALPKVNRRGALSKKELKKILKRININLPGDRLDALWKKFDDNGDNQLQLGEFVALMDAAEARPDVMAIFNEYDDGNKGHWRPDDVQRFFASTAPDDEATGWRAPKLDECRSLVVKYVALARDSAAASGSHSQCNGERLYVDGVKLLLSDPDGNGVCDPEHVHKVTHNMTHPLSHYFISASHNTYLDGNQLSSSSTPAAVEAALKRGVRVIELDAWDGDAGEPIVNHGRTLCKPTSFVKCVEAIAKFAFVASPYPVILTIENHCTGSQQEKQAEILHRMLGSVLFRPPKRADGDDFAGPEEWAAPKDLMGRVVLRDKPKRLPGGKHLSTSPTSNNGSDSSRKSNLRTRLSSAFGTGRGSNFADGSGRSHKSSGAGGGGAPGSGQISVSLANDEPVTPPEVSRAPMLAEMKRGVEEDNKPKQQQNDKTGKGGKKESRVQKLINEDATTTTTTFETGARGSIRARLNAAPASFRAAAQSLTNPTKNKKPRKSTRNKKAGGGGGATDDDDEDAEEDFIDEIVEEEGVGSVITEAEQRAREIRDQAGEKVENVMRAMGADANKLTWLHHSQQLATDSVPQLLELTYVKNVKLRVAHGRAPTTKRASLMTDASSSSVNSSSTATPSLPLRRKSGKLKIPDPSQYDVVIRYVQPPWRSSSSIKEDKMLQLCKPGAHAAAMNTYALSHLVRCYPGSRRMDSSNYDPTPAWCAGIQVAAINYQTKSQPVWTNHGFFSDNGGCGWVLKPPEMRHSRPFGTNQHVSEEDRSKPIWDLVFRSDIDSVDELSILIISGHRLPKPAGTTDPSRAGVIDPFVEFHFCGTEDDIERNAAQHRTKVVKDNGFDPAWNESFSFEVARPWFATITFVVKDKDEFLGGENFIGQAAIPLRLIRPGYRVVPLRSTACEPIIDAYLFCRFSWKRSSVRQASASVFSTAETAS